MANENCLFCRMAKGEIQAETVAENQQAFAIRDINPRAPVHVLIIPKRHVDDARLLEWGDKDLLAGLFELATDVAVAEGLKEQGYRLAFNVGEAAGMTISHLHLHLVGGRKLGPEG
ncbi:MAG: HIT domain-containing protein [Dehalococcoidia bacterium]